MKQKCITTLLACIYIHICNAQTTIISGDALKSNIIIKVLQDDGVLLTDQQKQCHDNCVWDVKKPFLSGSAGRKKRYLENDEALKNSLIPSFGVTNPLLNQPYDTSLKFLVSISKIGSYIFRGNQLNIPPQVSPQFSMLDKGDQTVLSVDPGASNFKVDYTTDQLFKATNETTISASLLSFFDIQQKLSFKLDESKKSHLNIAVGIFNNALGKVFNDVIDGNHCDPVNFLPLYELWNMYFNHTVSANDSVIRSFQGISYRKEQGGTFSQNESLNGTLQAGYSSQFLTAKTSGSENWTNSKNITFTQAAYVTYLNRRPTMQALPTAGQISSVWNIMKNCSFDPQQPTDIPARKPLIIKLKFGPVAGLDYIKNIIINKDEVIGKMKNKFITDIRIINETQNDYQYDPTTNSVILSVQILRDEDFINKNRSLTPLFNENIDLQLKYDHVNDGVSLGNVYPGIKITTSNYPLLTVANEGLVQPDTVTSYSYTVQGSFQLNQNQTLSAVRAPKVSQVNIQYPSTMSATDQALLQQTLLHPALKISSNAFTLTFSLPKTTTVFNTNVRELDNIVLNMNFFDGTGMEYNKPMEFSIAAPTGKINLNAVSAVSFTNASNLVQSLDLVKAVGGDSTLLNKSVAPGQASLKEMSETAPLTFLKTLETINKNFNVLIANDKYVLKPEFINADKLKNTVKPM